MKEKKRTKLKTAKTSQPSPIRKKKSTEYSLIRNCVRFIQHYEDGKVTMSFNTWNTVFLVCSSKLRFWHRDVTGGSIPGHNRTIYMQYVLIVFGLNVKNIYEDKIRFNKRKPDS